MADSNEAAIRVLLVEDDDGDAVLVRKCLSKSCEVKTVASLAAALDCLTSHEFDVALLDLSLPDAKGLEVVNEIRQLSADLPLVVLTGLADDETALEALRRGAQDYLVKPPASSELLRRSMEYARERQRIQSENARLVLNLELAARRDGLTGVMNRHAFAEESERLWLEAKQAHCPLSVVMIDIDHFKRINDVHGHLTGDEVIRTVAGLLAKHSRPEDLIARYGGEEFCVVLPATDEVGALRWAERVRNRVETTRFQIDEHNLQVTASFGVAGRTLSGPAEFLRLVERADESMMAAKQAGRNRVISHQLLVTYCDDDEESLAMRLNGSVATELMVPVIGYLHPQDTLKDAAKHLLALRVESATVIDDQRHLVGLIAEDDIMAQVLAKKPWSLPLGQAVSNQPICFTADTPVGEIWRFFQRVPLRRVVIMNDQVPVGILSRSSLLRWLFNQQHDPGTGSGTLDGSLQPLGSQLVERARGLELALAKTEGLPEVVATCSSLQSLIEGILSVASSSSSTDKDVVTGVGAVIQ